jgi:hypothetical protein
VRDISGKKLKEILVTSHVHIFVFFLVRNYPNLISLLPDKRGSEGWYYIAPTSNEYHGDTDFMRSITYFMTKI